VGAARRGKGEPAPDAEVRGGQHLGGVPEGGGVAGGGGARAHNGMGPGGGLPGGKGGPPVLPLPGTRAPRAVVPLGDRPRGLLPGVRKGGTSDRAVSG